jgi:hypothetical protein
MPLPPPPAAWQRAGRRAAGCPTCVALPHHTSVWTLRSHLGFTPFRGDCDQAHASFTAPWAGSGNGWEWPPDGRPGREEGTAR